MTESKEHMTDNGQRDDPFVLGLFGGSLKTATSASETSTGPTTVLGNRSERGTLSSVRETRSSSAPQRGTRRSHGDFRATGETSKLASSATSSATEARTYRRSLSDRLTLSLISAGLVCGITPSLTRKQSGQPIQVLALSTPVGGDAEKPRRDLSFSKGDAP